MLSVNSNISALSSQQTLQINARALARVMTQLSTGKLINSAADDPAGLAISTNLISQIRRLNQSIRNTNDGIAMLQTADGAAKSVIDMLQRMRELMVQKTNDTNNNNDKIFLDSEISNLRAGLSNVRNTTEWNGSNLVDGTGGDGYGNYSFKTGLEARSINYLKIQLNFPDINAASTQPQTTPFSGNLANYQYFVADGKNWSQAQAAANAMSRNGKIGYLANITSQEELDFIETYVIPGGATSDSVFTGGHLVSGSTTKWEWTSGPEAGTVFWDNGAVTGQFSNWDTHFGYPRTGTGATAEPVVSINGYFQPQFSNNFPNASMRYLVEFTSSGSQSGSAVTLQTIDQVDSTISSVTSIRSSIGVSISQLQFATDGMNNESNQFQASRSRIEDTDYSKATTEFAKRSIIQQAAQAMLAQANQQPQAILQLLKSIS